MKIAFYKGRTRLFNRLVSWYDKSPYSHCELVLDTATGLCGSSSFMDGGVRTKVIDLDSGHWDVVDIGGSEQALEAAHLWFATHNGQGYDVLGLLGFLWRRQTGQQSKWFCSEAVAAALGMPEAWRLDPATLHAIATQLNTRL